MVKVPSPIKWEVLKTVRLLHSGESIRPYCLAIARAQLAVAEKTRAAPEVLDAIRAEIAKLEQPQHEEGKKL